MWGSCTTTRPESFAKKWRGGHRRVIVLQKIHRRDMGGGYPMQKPRWSGLRPGSCIARWSLLGSCPAQDTPRRRLRRPRRAWRGWPTETSLRRRRRLVVAVSRGGCATLLAQRRLHRVLGLRRAHGITWRTRRRLRRLDGTACVQSRTVWGLRLLI